MPKRSTENVPNLPGREKQLINAPIVITAHANADFDALAAIIAAGKLYPEAVLIFPGTQERNLRNFFIESATYMFNFRQARDVDMASIRKLVIVDTRQRSRVPHMEPALDNKGLDIHLYDHHPDTDEDLQGSLCVVEPWGSTTAILVKRIIASGLTLNKDEATILGLGIFEDTGSFSFASTTEHDFEAAAWLKTQGMDLNAISELITRDLTAEQVTILNNLLQSARTYDIGGTQVVIAEATMERYVGDFALLAHKMLDMENLKVLFLLGRMGDRVHVVGRSRVPEINVGQICSNLGGGGHEYAASASIKDKTLSQIKDDLFSLLVSTAGSRKTVATLMSSPPITIPHQATIAEAEEIMNRFGMKAAPVMHSNARDVVGIVEYQTTTRALSHNLGKLPATEYMNDKFWSVQPADDLYTIMEIIVGQRQRLVPVVIENEMNNSQELVGVITRTDLINTLVEEPSRIPETLLPEKRRDRNVTSLLHERLPKGHIDLLTTAGKLGDSLSLAVYAVGGFVRDLMLGRPNFDLDLVVEGDGILFARELARELNGRVRPHNKFKTAVVIFTDDTGSEQRVDVATARLEYYEYPAALPTVELSSIKMDLYRRDFTINALAVQLNAASMGRLVDFFGSQKDMKDKLVRVLHSLSFVEDPTRILRAIRFEKRFDFRIGPQTTRLIKNALSLGLIDKLSGTRLLHELQNILNDEQPIACLRRMEDFGILSLIHPQLRLTPNKTEVAVEAEKVLNWYRMLYLPSQPEPWIVYLLCLMLNGKYVDVASVLRRLNLTEKQMHDFLTLRENTREAGMLISQWVNSEGTNSRLFNSLRQLKLEGLIFLMAHSKSDPLKRAISHYLTRLKDTQIDITGKDLENFGFTPGPSFGRVLTRVLEEKLDGNALTRQAQLELAFEHLREENVKDEEYRRSKRKAGIK